MCRRLIVSTVVRYAAPGHDSGVVYEIEMHTGRIVHRLTLPESPNRHRDPNPRGGLRGARGISVTGDRFILANAERLFVYDHDWGLRQELTHPWLGGIHDLHTDGDAVWVCCTNADLLVRMTLSGEVEAVWEWRREPTLRAALCLPRLPRVDRRLDYRRPEAMRSGVPNIVHLNGVAPAPEGGLLVSFGRVLSPLRYRRARVEGWLGSTALRLHLPPRKAGRHRSGHETVGTIPGSSSAIVRVRGDARPEVLVRVDDVAVPNHNVWMEGQTLLYNDSNRGRLVAVDLGGRREPRGIQVPGSSAFVRGLARLSSTRFLVGGHGPAAVHLVDLACGAVTRTFPVGDDPAEAIYGIAVIPG